jgi:hypothetical protein
MTMAGGYCDPNGDGSYADGNWDQGWYDYHAACMGVPPQPTCPCTGVENNFCQHAPNTAGCPMTMAGGYCDPNGDGSYADGDWNKGWYDYHDACAP